jgi:hypothetical protein
MKSRVYGVRRPVGALESGDKVTEPGAVATGLRRDTELGEVF